MEEPVFLVTNKTDARSPWEDNQDARVYFSLSDYYWPFQVSSVNPTGIPYRYNASVNLQACTSSDFPCFSCLGVNSMHLGPQISCTFQPGKFKMRAIAPVLSQDVWVDTFSHTHTTELSALCFLFVNQCNMLLRIRAPIHHSGVRSNTQQAPLGAHN